MNIKKHNVKEEHYPNFDFCEKLTKAGFPSTECVFAENIEGKAEIFLHEQIISEEYSNYLYVCPNVSELLDQMPLHRESITLVSQNEIVFMGWSFYGNYADALAEAWLYFKKH